MDNHPNPKQRRTGLGKGLGALILAQDSLSALTPDTESGVENSPGHHSGVLEVDINKVEPNKDQPRKRFDEERLNELADSIKQFGIIQPIVVTKINDDFYKIVAGERRWRAARIAQLKTIPVIVKDLEDMEVLQIALIENIQRQDLNPIEEALCYQHLCDVFFFRQEDIALKVGKSRSSISGIMSLLKLDPRVQNLIAEGRLTASHGRKLLEVENGALQFDLGEKIIEGDLNISQIGAHLEALHENNVPEEKKEKTVSNNAQYRSIEKDLMTIFGTKVAIKGKKDKGKIEIEYYEQDELDRLIGLFKMIK